MSIETHRFPSGEMRASDADRDLAIAELSEHFQTGRLTQDEFDDRSAQALRASTGRELSGLFTDLPGLAHPGGAPSRLDRSPRGGWSGAAIVGVVAAIAIVSLLGHVGHGGIGRGGFGWLIPVFVVLFTVRRIVRRR